jgi:hypothetical protein
MPRPPVFVRPIAPALVLALTTGCYAGLPGTADTGDTSGPGADTDAATSGGADETGGTPSACAGEVQDVGPTPLRRLTRREYANAVADLTGVVADVGATTRAGGRHYLRPAKLDCTATPSAQYTPDAPDGSTSWVRAPS